MQLSRARRLSSDGTDVPGSVFDIGCIEHHVSGLGVFVPLAAGGKIHRAQLPLPYGIIDTGLEPAFLLLIADFEPELDELNPSFHDVLFNQWAAFEESRVLFRSAKAHHVFDSSAVVPTAIKDDDLARCGKMGHVTLKVHLRLLAIGRRGQGHHSEHARADSLGDRSDRASLAGGIPAFKHNNDPQSLVLDPVLQFTKFLLQFAQFVFVLFTRHSGWCFLRFRLRFRL